MSLSKSRIVWLAVLTLVLLPLLAACGGTTASPTAVPAATSTTAPPAAADTEVPAADPTDTAAPRLWHLPPFRPR